MTLTNVNVSLTILADVLATLGLSDQSLKGIAKSWSIALTNGTGAGQANTVYAKSRTIGGSPDSVDLTGALTDAFGSTITNARIKVFAIFNPSTHDITLDTTITNGWQTAINGTVVIKPNTAFLLATDQAAAYTVTAGTGDLIQVSGTNGDTYQLILVGANA